MKKEIILAGFGGQGVLALGQMLAYGGMSEGKEVSWFPSYGPEMRGGTANCAVVISDREISSPVVSRPDILIAMNKPSLLKFLPAIKKGGIVIYNSSLISDFVKRGDVTYYAIPANVIAEEAGTVKAANVVLGEIIINVSKVISPEAFTAGMKKVLPQKEHIITLNMNVREAAKKYLETKIDLRRIS